MAEINSYVRGTLARIAISIKNAAGTDVDPTTGPTVKYRNPAGTVTTKVYPTDTEVVKDSVGDFHIDVDADSEGKWSYYWSGIGTNKGADKGEFIVLDDVFA